MVSVLKFLRWLFQKCAAALLMVVLALCAYGLWLFLRDTVDFDQYRTDLVLTLSGERRQIREAMADVEQRLDELTVTMEAEQSRIRQAEKVIATLTELESTWDRLIGNPEQQRANAEQKARMENLRRDAQANLADLRTKFQRTVWEKDGLQIALGRLETQIKAVEEKQSQAFHYLRDAWERSRVWLAVALALYFFGPTVGRLTLYYGLAPLVTRGRPVRLTPELAVLPEVGGNHVSIDVALNEGERLWVREKFLQASDEGLQKKTRFLLDWHIPFTCLASGLVELVEMTPAAGSRSQRATLSNQANPHIELALLTLPEGAALVLRPSYLAAVALGADRRLQIRRRWQLLRWQSWVTLQFRYFEFAGPCRLIVSGSRGVRVEKLVPRGDGTPGARRTNQDATIGFTPNLDYKPVRAETFWSYYREMNPLFDDLFSGHGLFLCQEITAGAGAGAARKFWAGLWNGMLKVFGL